MLTGECDELRIVYSGKCSAAENMAFDEAILDYVVEEEPEAAVGWLRLYGWEKPTVSFGRFQRPKREVDLEKARELGMDLVKRPTGGKALVHDDEVTYCVILPAKSPLAKCSIAESHRRLADGLARALKSFGLDVSVGKPESSGKRGATVPCFAEHLAESVLIDNKKVAGSAQFRRKGGVLQHGSILRSLDYKLHEELFGRAAKGFARKAVGLKALLPKAPSVEELSCAVAEGMAAVVSAGNKRIIDNVPAWILDRTRRLCAEKYSRLDWSARREEGQ